MWFVRVCVVSFFASSAACGYRLRQKEHDQTQAKWKYLAWKKSYSWYNQHYFMKYDDTKDNHIHFEPIKANEDLSNLFVLVPTKPYTAKFHVTTAAELDKCLVIPPAPTTNTYGMDFEVVFDRWKISNITADSDCLQLEIENTKAGSKFKSTQFEKDVYLDSWSDGADTGVESATLVSNDGDVFIPNIRPNPHEKEQARNAWWSYLAWRWWRGLRSGELYFMKYRDTTRPHIYFEPIKVDEDFHNLFVLVHTEGQIGKFHVTTEAKRDKCLAKPDLTKIDDSGTVALGSLKISDVTADACLQFEIEDDDKDGGKLKNTQFGKDLWLESWYHDHMELARLHSGDHEKFLFANMSQIPRS
eukprot:TRINITY_DN14362_c0_g1_i1.p1 TRINITY_DN14362_c0_g1~~TRINITY_DN14362_c0_g1_i1.p1  ORF type:complete len:358 (+),score=36.18 TRINITY_DN14362_c0_g1_i1:60-1133(+)